jgi:hypothetical protein
MGKNLNRYSPARMVFIAILLLVLTRPLSAQYNENVIKAAYIERITRFVEWPVHDSLLLSDKFVIGVNEESDFYYTLTEIFKEKMIKDRRVIIIPIKGPEQLTNCNICYLSENSKPLIRNFVSAANSSGTLLISGTTGFGKAGVHINFYLEDEKLKFEINEKSVGLAGFKVSYLLMQNTRIIK